VGQKEGGGWKGQIEKLPVKWSKKERPRGGGVSDIEKRPVRDCSGQEEDCIQGRGRG